MDLPVHRMIRKDLRFSVKAMSHYGSLPKSFSRCVLKCSSTSLTGPSRGVVTVASQPASPPPTKITSKDLARAVGKDIFPSFLYSQKSTVRATFRGVIWRGPVCCPNACFFSNSYSPEVDLSQWLEQVCTYGLISKADIVLQAGQN